MLKFALLSVCVALATCQVHHPGQNAGHHHPTHPTHPTKVANLAHTHPTHPTHPPQHADHIKDSYKFTVEGSYMVMNTHDTCYLWKLSDADVALTTDPATLTSVEAKMFAKLGDGSVSTATSVDKHSTTIDHHVLGRCDHHSIMEFGAAASTN